MRFVRRAVEVGRGLGGAHAIVAAGALGLCFVPLFDVLGFEFAAAMGLLLAYVAGFRACGSAARARDRAAGAGGAAFPGGDFLRVLAENATLLVTPLAIIGLDAHRVPTCNWSAGLGFWGILPVPAVVYGTCLGFLFGLAFGAKRGRIAFVLWSVLTYLHAIRILLREPPKFAFNAFAGYFPGPIYDSDVRIGASLLVSRAAVLLQAVLALGLATLGWDGLRFRLRSAGRDWRGPRAALAAISTGSAIALVAIWIFRAPLGLQLDRGFIQRALGGRIETAHCILYYDRTAYSPARAARFAAEHESRWDQNATFFQLRPKAKMGSYIYGSAEQKKRLMGAAGTSFEDAWNNELHINASSDDPHPALTHEMAHLFAAQIDRWVPVQWMIGIHEGIAVAAEWNEESARLEMTPHQACAAMDSLHVLPDLRRSLSAFGFWTQSGARAYTACGSFVRFLVDTRGMPRFQQLWRRGNFRSAYGEPLDALLVEWRQMLHTTAVDAMQMRRAEQLFRPPGIFAQPCAHEQARIEFDAGSALAGGDATTAESLYARLVSIDAKDPEHALDLGRARLHGDDPVGAAMAARLVLDDASASRGRAGRAWRLLGDAAWLARGTPAAARIGAPPESAYAHGAALAATTADARAYEVALQALGDSRLGDGLRDYLTDRGLGDEAGLARLATACATAPRAGLPHYLLGRRLVFAGDAVAARDELVISLQSGDLGPLTALTARELLGRARFESGDFQGAAVEFQRLAAAPGAPEWRRLGWNDWLGRCRRAGANPGP